MSKKQVSTARRLATGMFAGVVAMSLMVPGQLAFADYYFGDYDSEVGMYDGGVDNSGEGWSYTAEGSEMSLVDYVGEAITAVNQDLTIELEGTNEVEQINVQNGDLTIIGDEDKDGTDKPDLVLTGDDDGAHSCARITADAGDVTIKDADVYVKYASGHIDGDEVSIIRSATYLGDESKDFWIYGNKDVLLQGSVINANDIYSGRTLTIENTDLDVVPADTGYDEWLVENDKWLQQAVTANRGIELIGENQPYNVVKYTDEDGDTWYYLDTGDKDKVHLVATEKPAYYGTSKAMPKTGDNTMTLVFAAGSALAMSAAAAAFALRKRNEER